jgi:hypothetical protein
MKRHLEDIIWDKRSESQFNPHDGEDPNWLWTSETQDEMAQHYSNLENKEKDK